MDISNQIQEISADNAIEAQRKVIRLALDDIAVQVGTAHREAGLGFPVYLTVPGSGTSLVTLACALDPSDQEWNQASEIVCRIVGLRLGDIRLCGRSIPCAVTNAAMAVAEVTPETLELRRERD
jgi:hypothetical protein